MEALGPPRKFFRASKKTQNLGTSTATSQKLRTMRVIEHVMGFAGGLWGGIITVEMQTRFEKESTVGSSWTSSNSETLTEIHTRIATFPVPLG